MITLSCVMIVFYHITDGVARMPPILDLTYTQAEQIVKDSRTKEWFRTGIYPRIRPCGRQISV